MSEVFILSKISLEIFWIRIGEYNFPYPLFGEIVSDLVSQAFIPRTPSSSPAITCPEPTLNWTQEVSNALPSAKEAIYEILT